MLEQKLTTTEKKDKYSGTDLEVNDKVLDKFDFANQQKEKHKTVANHLIIEGQWFHIVFKPGVHSFIQRQLIPYKFENGQYVASSKKLDLYLLMINITNDGSLFYKAKLEGEDNYVYLKKNIIDNCIKGPHPIARLSILLEEVFVPAFFSDETTLVAKKTTAFSNEGTVLDPKMGEYACEINANTKVHVYEKIGDYAAVKCIGGDVDENKSYLIKWNDLVYDLVEMPPDPSTIRHNIKNSDTIEKIVTKYYKPHDDFNINYFINALLFINNPNRVKKDNPLVGIYLEDDSYWQIIKEKFNLQTGLINIIPGRAIWIPSQAYMEGIYDFLPNVGDFVEDWFKDFEDTGEKLLAQIKKYWVDGIGVNISAYAGGTFGIPRIDRDIKCTVIRNGDTIILKKYNATGVGAEVGVGAGIEFGSKKSAISGGATAGMEMSIMGRLYSLLEFNIPLDAKQLIQWVKNKSSDINPFYLIIQKGVPGFLIDFLDSFKETEEVDPFLRRAVTGILIEGQLGANAKLGAVEAKKNDNSYAGRQKGKDAVAYADDQTIKKLTDSDVDFIRDKTGGLIDRDLLNKRASFFGRILDKIGISLGLFLKLGFSISKEDVYHKERKSKIILTANLAGDYKVPFFTSGAMNKTLGIELNIQEKENGEFDLFKDVAIFLQDGEVEWYDGNSSLYYINLNKDLFIKLVTQFKSLDGILEYVTGIKMNPDSVTKEDILMPTFSRYHINSDKLVKMASFQLEKKLRGINLQRKNKQVMSKDYKSFFPRFSAYFEIDHQKMKDVKFSNFLVKNLTGHDKDDIIKQLWNIFIMDPTANHEFPKELLQKLGETGSDKILDSLKQSFNQFLQQIIEKNAWHFRAEFSVMAALGFDLGAGVKGAIDANGEGKLIWEPSEKIKTKINDELIDYLENIKNSSQLLLFNDENIYETLIQNLTTDLTKK
ncbi:hypothetical protein KMW28_12845 [Flammeovirga yaeyamensis]|uniref:Uncharacterized protein n=1 Tax=Flammeovirga yaeyamensis TaxID=367791 RepID=A0AAX1MZ37_9BACT|nr:hypothetical protein [Flammeovirga yaeyamensis]MBB3695943.1 hypothetical protein [Flammeovirga yaeyamensis]NMF34631.1 hypothetical protein [Flammeovirga yaeyamensis]QWG00540.1 hypothetical protein KMW28_12845 [Flammeovirga yaeyamensis]